MGLMGSIISGGASIVGGLLGNSAQNATNAQNYEISKENRDWAEKMSNTAYQRKMADLKEAGLNPMLAMDGAGASTPTSTPATMVSGGQHLATGIANSAQSLLSADIAKANIAKTEAETDRIKGLTPLEIQEREALTRKVESGILNDSVMRNFTQAQTAHEKAKIINTALMKSDILAGIDLKYKTGSNLLNNDELVNIQTEVAKLGLKNEQAQQEVIKKTRELAEEKLQLQLDEAKYRRNQIGEVPKNYFRNELGEWIEKLSPLKFR